MRPSRGIAHDAPIRKRFDVTDPLPNESAHRTKLFICGAGVRVPGHLTVETMGILQSCSRIFSPLPAVALELLPIELSHRFEPVERDEMRVPGDGIAQVDLVERILAAAAANAPVAYLAQGNPMVFDQLAQELVEQARLRAISYEIKPAISSIDTILVDLQLDLQAGVQVFDARAFVVNGIRPRVDVACVLIDPAATAAPPFSPPLEHAGSSLSLLREHLLRFYPPRHAVMFVASAAGVGGGAIFAHFTVDELDGTVDIEAIKTASLVVPALSLPVAERMVADHLVERSTLWRTARKTEFQA